MQSRPGTLGGTLVGSVREEVESAVTARPPGPGGRVPSEGPGYQTHVDHCRVQDKRPDPEQGEPACGREPTEHQPRGCLADLLGAGTFWKVGAAIDRRGSRGGGVHGVGGTGGDNSPSRTLSGLWLRGVSSRMVSGRSIPADDSTALHHPPISVFTAQEEKGVVTRTHLEIY